MSEFIKNTINYKYFKEHFDSTEVYLHTSGLYKRLKIENFNQMDLNSNIILYPNKALLNNFLDKNSDKFFNIIYLHGIRHFKSIENQKFLSLFKNLKYKIHYVGKFDSFWKDVKNSKLLYPQDSYQYDNKTHENLNYYPLFFKRRRQKMFLNKIKNVLFYPHLSYKLLNKKSIYYAGTLNFEENLITSVKQKYEFIDWLKIYKLLILENKADFDSQISKINNLKDFLLNSFSFQNYYLVVEIYLILLRSIIIQLLEIIFKDFDYLNRRYRSINIYNQIDNSENLYIDLFSKVGFDKIYPRRDEIKRNKKNYCFFEISEKLLFMDKNKSNEYLKKNTDLLIDKIKKFDFKVN